LITELELNTIKLLMILLLQVTCEVRLVEFILPESVRLSGMITPDATFKSAAATKTP